MDCSVSEIASAADDVAGCGGARFVVAVLEVREEGEDLLFFEKRAGLSSSGFGSSSSRLLLGLKRLSKSCSFEPVFGF